MKNELAALERDLDAFNIILVRQKVENEVRKNSCDLTVIAFIL